MARAWTQQESAYLFRTAPRAGVAWCAGQLGRDEADCAARLAQLAPGAKPKPRLKPAPKPEPKPAPKPTAEPKQAAARDGLAGMSRLDILKCIARGEDPLAMAGKEA